MKIQPSDKPMEHNLSYAEIAQRNIQGIAHADLSLDLAITECRSCLIINMIDAKCCDRRFKIACQLDINVVDHKIAAILESLSAEEHGCLRSCKPFIGFFQAVIRQLGRCTGHAASRAFQRGQRT